jgi:hypothetical protein
VRLKTLEFPRSPGAEGREAQTAGAIAELTGARVRAQNDGDGILERSVGHHHFEPLGEPALAEDDGTLQHTPGNVAA